MATQDGEVVRPQEGGINGGWMTSRVADPGNGPPGMSAQCEPYPDGSTGYDIVTFNVVKV